MPRCLSKITTQVCVFTFVSRMVFYIFINVILKCNSVSILILNLLCVCVKAHTTNLLTFDLRSSEITR